MDEQRRKSILLEIAARSVYSFSRQTEQQQQLNHVPGRPFVPVTGARKRRKQIDGMSRVEAI